MKKLTISIDNVWCTRKRELRKALQTQRILVRFPYVSEKAGKTTVQHPQEKGLPQFTNLSEDGHFMQMRYPKISKSHKSSYRIYDSDCSRKLRHFYFLLLRGEMILTFYLVRNDLRHGTNFKSYQLWFQECGSHVVCQLLCSCRK